MFPHDSFDSILALCDVLCVATNIELDPKLLNKAMRLGHMKTKKAVVHQALEEYVQRREQQKILSLFGAAVAEEPFDYKAQRKVK